MRHYLLKTWALAWPMMLSNISVPLLGLIDTAILGHLDSPQYLAAVALGASLISIVFSSLNFLRMGTTGLSAQSFHQHPQAQRLLMQGLLLALVLALFIWVFKPWIATAGLYLMAVPDNLHPLAESYTHIRLWGAPAVLLTYVIIGWSIGQQNSSLALICLTLVSITNIVLDYVLIHQWGMKSDGAAYATLIAEYAGLITAICLLKYYFPWLQFGSPQLLSGIMRLLTLNRDLFIRSLCLLFVFAFFHAQGAQLGETVLAANAILMQLVLFQSYLLDGFANATEALIGHATQQLQRYRQVLKATAACSFVTALVLCLAYLIAEPWLIRGFTQQQAVITAANQQLWWVIVLPLVSVWGYWLDGVAVGLTASKAMRNCLLISTWLVFIPCWWWFQSSGNTALWLAFFVFSISRAVMLLPVLNTKNPGSPG